MNLSHLGHYLDTEPKFFKTLERIDCEIHKSGGGNAQKLGRFISTRAMSVFYAAPLEAGAAIKNAFISVGHVFGCVANGAASTVLYLYRFQKLAAFQKECSNLDSLQKSMLKTVSLALGTLSSLTIGVLSPTHNLHVQQKLGLHFHIPANAVVPAAAPSGQSSENQQEADRLFNEQLIEISRQAAQQRVVIPADDKTFETPKATARSAGSIFDSANDATHQEVKREINNNAANSLRDFEDLHISDEEDDDTSSLGEKAHEDAAVTVVFSKPQAVAKSEEETAKAAETKVETVRELPATLASVDDKKTEVVNSTPAKEAQTPNAPKPLFQPYFHPVPHMPIASFNQQMSYTPNAYANYQTQPLRTMYQPLGTPPRPVTYAQHGQFIQQQPMVFAQPGLSINPQQQPRVAYQQYPYATFPQNQPNPNEKK